MHNTTASIQHSSSTIQVRVHVYDTMKTELFQHWIWPGSCRQLVSGRTPPATNAGRGPKFAKPVAPTR
jgi:hypothetical protein